MKNFAKTLAFGLALLATGAMSLGIANAAEPAQHQNILTNGSIASAQGNDKVFTGDVRIDRIFRNEDMSNTSVTFEPGARTAWHYHPKGQLLIVTSGFGLTQEWGQPIKELHAGDIVWCPPNVKHWHGGGYQTAMTHISVSLFENGKNVTWLDKVTDKEYQGK